MEYDHEALLWRLGDCALRIRPDVCRGIRAGGGLVGGSSSAADLLNKQHFASHAYPGGQWEVNALLENLIII